MRMYDLIYKKRNGEALTDEEIRWLIQSYTAGSIPDYQMAAMAMAIVWRSMNDREIATLTEAMAQSGETVDLSEFGTLSVDKHSTGGVGDKTTLIAAPIAAACGVKLAKMSGRGLGHTGGTVDKLESMRGYRTELSRDEFFDQVRRIGIAVVGQSGNMTPADKKLYALRDVTATVDSIPLIVSSVMSKKLAAGAHTVVLDVKAGSGAFMPDLESAAELAEKMVQIGNACGRRMAALVTNMDLPLGYAVGNSLEVQEAISVLKGEHHGDLREICLALSAAMLTHGLSIPYEEAANMAQDALNSGKAFRKFREWIGAQGGDCAWIDDPSLFPKAAFRRKIHAMQDGWISAMNTAEIGNTSSMLGAGRVRHGDPIDSAAGIVLRRKTGDRIRKGDLLATLYTNKEETLDEAEARFRAALTFQKEAVEAPKLILAQIGLS